MPSVTPIPKNLLKMARNNQRKMEQNKRNNLTRKLRKIRNNAENKERVEKAYSKLQARLNALKRKSSSNFVKVTSNNLKGYKKTKGRSTTLNRIKNLTKKTTRK
jgi:hypothetical protein